MTRQATAYLLFNREMVLVRNTKPLSPLHPLWETFSTTVEDRAGFQETMRQMLIEKIGVSPRNLTLIGIDDEGNGLLLGSFLPDEFPRIKFCGTGVLGLGVFGFGEISGPGFSLRTSVQISSHLSPLSRYARGLGVSPEDFDLKRASGKRAIEVQIL